MDDRLNAIETALAHQDQQITELTDVINRQWQEIEMLKKLLMKAEAKISSLASDGGDPHAGLSTTEIAAMEKPPHY